MKIFKIIIFCAFICMVTLSSCHSTSPESSEPKQELEDTLEVKDELPYGVTDTIDGEKVSAQCAKVNYDLEELEQRIENVKSPEMLMHVRAEYRQEIDSILKKAEEFPAKEKNIIDNNYTRIKTAYAKVCKEYEVPVEGVIANLKICLKQISEVNTKQDLSTFMDGRIGMLDNLDIIYLCVEENSPKLREVQSLAHQLKNELYDKKVKFGEN